MGVNLEKLSLATVGVVDPRVEKMFQKHVRHILDDVSNRPGEPAKRTLTLELEMTPVIERDKDTGECTVETIRVGVKGKTKTPVYQTKAYPMKITNNGLFFNREIPERLDQPSLIPDEPSEVREPKD